MILRVDYKNGDYITVEANNFVEDGVHHTFFQHEKAKGILPGKSMFVLKTRSENITSVRQCKRHKPLRRNIQTGNTVSRILAHCLRLKTELELDTMIRLIARGDEELMMDLYGYDVNRKGQASIDYILSLLKSD